MLSFETLVFPVMTMMGLAFLYSLILRSFRDTLASSLAFGVLFGLSIILAMSAPIHIGDDLIFDLRGLLVGLSVVFVGWIAGIITLVIGIAYRLFLGGAGAYLGCFGLIIAFGIGACWRLLAGKMSRSTLVSDAAFGVVISLSLFSIFLLPMDVAISVLAEIAPPVVVANILGAVGLGFVLRREAQYVRDTEQLRIYASIDPLTNLLNRRGAADQLRRMSDRTVQGRALFYLDIDHFKEINDVYGHAAGDAALATVAARIEGSVRERVIFSRHGGDEFTLFVPNISEESVRVIGERFRRSVCDAPIQFQNQSFSLSISVGACWTNSPATFDEMLESADAELLRAKAQGRNRLSLADPVRASVAVRQDWPLATGALH